MKKIIIILGIILALAAIAFGVYFAWKNAQTILTPPTDSTPSQNPGAITIPATPITSTTAPTAALKLTMLSDQPVFDYWIFSQENSVFYITQDGKFFKLKDNAEDEAITSEVILNIQAVKSTFDGKRVLIQYGDLNSPKFKIFNSETKVFEMLPGNIVAANFSPDAKQIAYLEKSSGNLMIKDLIGAKPKTTKIMTILQNDFNLQWIVPEKIILLPKPSAFYPSSAWVVDIKNKTITSLANEMSGLIIKWSADGKIGLEFSSQSQGRISRLNLIDNKGAVQANLDFMTLPEKCLILQPKIYCAIPQNIPPRTVLPDDYLKRAVYFNDVFYQIDISQNFFTEIPIGTESIIDAVNLKLIDNKLFFINRYDDKVYSLEL